MTTFNRRLFALAAILFLPLHVCLAQTNSSQAPSGLITFSFDNVTAPVWDLSGDLTFEQNMLGVGDAPSPLAFSLSVTQDARGVLNGSGGALITVGNDVIGGCYTLP